MYVFLLHSKIITVRKQCLLLKYYSFNRFGVAGSVLLIPSLVTQWVIHPFPPNLKNIIPPKLLELESWDIEKMFTSLYVPCVMSHVSLITCHLSPVINISIFFLLIFLYFIYIYIYIYIFFFIFIFK